MTLRRLVVFVSLGVIAGTAAYDVIRRIQEKQAQERFMAARQHLQMAPREHSSKQSAVPEALNLRNPLAVSH